MGDDSLYNELDDAAQDCTLTGRHQRFIPETDLKEIPTLPKIKDVIKKEFKFWHRWFDSSLATRTYEQAPKVLAILTLIGSTKRIKDLHAEGLTDVDLPLSRKEKRGPVLTSASSGKQFHTFARHSSTASSFLEKQWEVLAPRLSVSGDHIALNDHCALPITITDGRSNEGGSSSVTRGVIHKGHFSGFEVKHDGDLEIAIKELKPVDDLTAWKVFEKERRNLNEINKISLHPHLLRAIATCMVCSRYYILFPWAEGGDLDEFWKKRKDEPADANLVLWSLKQMAGLTDALRLMHDINHRHGDLKPGNILLFPQGNPFCRSREGLQETLVIADYGVSQRHQKATYERTKGTKTKATTRSYEAPEADGDQTDPRSRKYDLWSVGCIFLEFIVWLLHGYGAVSGFESQRIAKGKMNGGHACFYAIEDDEEQSHTEVNEAVKDAVTTILNDPRCTGSTALGDLVGLISKYLLLIDATQRDTAQDFHEKLVAIVSEAEGQSSYLLREVGSHPDIPPAFRYNGKSEGKKLPTIDDMQA